MRRVVTLASLLLLLAGMLPLLGGAWACEPEQLVQGCRIDDGACVCGLGCDTSFRYSTRDQCQTALKGEKADPCESTPCKNSGVCSQIVRDPGYQCLCVNTGYYGHVCHKKCPTPEEFNNMDPSTQFPIECMLI
ncbi:protein crumbs homolog 2-like [Homarus americanus]|uniref:protein crumbs homolog 2-like n=1 Tax=Homarus americanus TaxID=6706 RepID=UPI001C47E6C7|nr:protein crumbs homolog 2-like [Homarus americanus]